MLIRRKLWVTLIWVQSFQTSVCTKRPYWRHRCTLMFAISGSHSEPETPLFFFFFFLEPQRSSLQVLLNWPLDYFKLTLVRVRTTAYSPSFLPLLWDGGWSDRVGADSWMSDFFQFVFATLPDCFMTCFPNKSSPVPLSLAADETCRLLTLGGGGAQAV